jgi:hypothetical protein
MSVASSFSAPVRTKLVGEDYLQTFDQKFQVRRAPPLRAGMPAVAPVEEYRARTEREFERSKGTLLDLWA